MGKKQSYREPIQRNREQRIKRKCDKIHLIDINGALDHKLTCLDCMEIARIERADRIVFYLSVAICSSAVGLGTVFYYHHQHVEHFMRQNLDPLLNKIRKFII